MHTPHNVWKKVKASQSCLTLHDLMDCTVHGILQARILEWVAFPFSRRSSQPTGWIQSPALQLNSSLAEPPGKAKNTGAGSLSLLWQILGMEPGSPALQVDSLPPELPGMPQTVYIAPPSPFPVSVKFFAKLLVSRFFLIFCTRTEMQLLGVISIICPTFLFPNI